MIPTFFRVVLLLVFVAGIAACSRNPLATALPLNLADIPKIQPQLDRLGAEERELVLTWEPKSITLATGKVMKSAD